MLSLATTAHGDPSVPPWSEPADLPIAGWARSVAPGKDEVPVFTMPNRTDPKRGALRAAAHPPLYGALRGPGCGGRWLLIGPFAWVCSDEAEPSADDASPFAGPRGITPPTRPTDDGLGYRYFFVGENGASGFRDLAHAGEDAPESEFDPGFAVAIVEQQTAHGQTWGKTRHGVWIALSELFAAQPTTLHGQLLSPSTSADAPVDAAWVVVEHAMTFADPLASKRVGVRLRFDVVGWREEKATAAGKMVRITADDVSPTEWMHAKDLAHPTTAPPPPEVGSAEKWIDVELATQTLMAYEGTRPVFTALVSAGRGPQGSDTATPKGVHRIWVKLLATNMDNLENEDVEHHYSIEDVPYVQFFDKAVALHGAFWHHAFGTPHSHGCVNLAPVDARWLFEFTAPQVPAGWSAILPVHADPATLVRVR